MKLHKLTQSKLDDYKLRSNFTEDEEITFDMLSKQIYQRDSNPVIRVN